MTAFRAGVLAVVVALLLAGCGRVGPPVRPQRKAPDASPSHSAQDPLQQDEEEEEQP